MYNQPQSPSLYVGDLAADVTEHTLHEVFSSVGNVASIRVCRDHSSRRSLGYAYVNFHNADDADRAIQTLNFSEINGKQCRIMWSQRDPTLRKSGLGNIFIKNLDPSVDNKSLMDLFSVFGNILSCKVSMGADGRSKGYGYVHFDSTEAAKKAIEKYDKSYILGHQISVTLFQRREDREKQLEWTNIFIKNIPQDWDEEYLNHFFSEFGKTTSIKISRDLEPNPNSEYAHRGYGFVNFEDHETAKRAVDHLNNQPYEVGNGVFLRVERFKSKIQRQRDDVYARKYDQTHKHNGVSLYIKNLDDSIDEGSLNDLFSKYGRTISTRVMRDKNGHSRGFGFVTFSNVEEARNAITELHNTTIWGKPLKVYLAVPADQRKAQNQANPFFSRPGMPYPPMFGVPMYMQPNQVSGGPRPFSMMQVMQRPSQHRPPVPVRGYPIPSYSMNQFNPSGQPFPNTNQFPQQPHPHPTHQHPQQPHPQQMQRKPRTAKSMPNQRNQRQIIHGNEPLTSQILTSVSEEQRKLLIGERLYPKIAELCPESAPKVTGMLLEMDNTELLHLLETDASLQQKVEEALNVLQNYSQSH